jgi:cellulase (glycosyl hydrolase family 5)
MAVVAAAASVCACAVAVAATTSSASDLRSRGVRSYSTGATLPLRTAVFDPAIVPLDQPTGFAMIHGAGAQFVRLAVRWSGIAPAVRPDGFDAADPNSVGYSWLQLDGTLEAAETAGLTPILDIVGAPDWALKTRPSGVNAGTPRASDLGDFATALATHYNGLTTGVPAEHVFQVWNEPNLSLYLNPVSGSAYRGMVNAVSDAVHAVDPANLVVAGDLDPFGHPKSKKQKWHSVAPLAFMRSMLCLSKGRHPHATCRNAARFDVWSHHPYTFGGPFGRAKLPDDVELGDLPRMEALLQAGVRLHHVVSAQPVQFWVTEFGWDTNPPRRHAASLSLAARWTAESLHQMWLSGVSLVTWFLLVDHPSPSAFQSGLYFHSSSLDGARPKPTLTAFRFPFVAYLGKRKTVAIWGRDATSDRQVVTVQRRRGRSGRWRTVASVRSNTSGIFKANLRLKASKKDWLRAVAPGSGTSLAFSLKVPHAPHIGPWGN